VFVLHVTEPHLAIPALLDRIHSRGLSLPRLKTCNVSLEDVFVKMTGRHIREDGESND
jgi:ABC-2 type transport system ATP-binding protein